MPKKLIFFATVKIDFGQKRPKWRNWHSKTQLTSHTTFTYDLSITTRWRISPKSVRPQLCAICVYPLRQERSQVGPLLSFVWLLALTHVQLIHIPLCFANSFFLCLFLSRLYAYTYTTKTAIFVERIEQLAYAVYNREWAQWINLCV